MSNFRDVLITQVAETIISSGVTRGMRRGTANRLAEKIVEELFQSDNWEAVQEYLYERIDHDLPGRSCALLFK